MLVYFEYQWFVNYWVNRDRSFYIEILLEMINLEKFLKMIFVGGNIFKKNYILI